MDKDWDGFRLHFEKVNNGFFEKIQSQYPSLSAKDLKLCALMKLNLETKEIASILDISPESVKVARHRLRKKFDLPTDQSLHAFLRSL
jgi:DNA-binding CsgD family transcriptional regulator